MQVIYIDVLFFLNLIMDFFIFRITAILLNYKIPKYKLFVGSLLASLFYCLGICIKPLQELPTFFYQLCIPIVSILYMYKPLTIKKFLKDYLIAMVVAWGIGGIGFNLYYIALRHSIKESILIPILAGGMLWGIIESSLTWIRKRRIGIEYEYNIAVEHEGGKIDLKGFLDTGNQLYTTNHQPVTVIPLEDIASILSSQVVELIKSCEREDPIKILIDRPNKQTKLYLIPFESVGRKNGILIGIKIEKMVLRRGTYENILENCVVGITPYKLFKEKEYHALIHPEFILIK